MTDKECLYKSELEHLIGRLYRGDMTVMVYFLLKDTPDMDSLLEYLTGESPKSDLEKVDDEIHTPTFKEWFEQGELL